MITERLLNGSESAADPADKLPAGMGSADVRGKQNLNSVQKEGHRSGCDGGEYSPGHGVAVMGSDC